MREDQKNQFMYADPAPIKTIQATGVKHDSAKLPLDLLDATALEGVAKVLAFGAGKYAAHNWRSGFKYSRLLAALLRHTFAIMRGELNDPESGLPHIDHLGCCWMFLSNMMKTRPDLNDLYDHTRGDQNAQNVKTDKDINEMYR